MAYAKASARRTRPRARLAASSARCNLAAEVSFSEALALERELQQLCFQSEDAKEGIAAYNEKRTPYSRPANASHTMSLRLVGLE